jgi:hypothetical protein
MQIERYTESLTISHKDAVKLIVASIAIDLVQTAFDFLPLVGWIINIGIDLLTWLFFYMWFKRLGVNFNNFKRFLFFNSGLILDLIPFVNSFAWTVDILMVLGTLKLQNKR